MDDPLQHRPVDLDVAVGDADLRLLRDVLPLDRDLRFSVGLLDVGDLALVGELAEGHLLGLDRRGPLEIGAALHAAAAAFSTSWTVTRPSAPVPSTSSISTPASWALRIAASVALCFWARFWRRFSPSSIAL